MTLKPIDSYCHLFSAHYAVEEAAAVGWAYVTGHYPHAGAVTRAAAAESLFSWDRLEDAVKWFFDLGTDFVLSSLMEVLSLEGYFRTFKKLFGTAALEELPANRQGDAGQNRQQ